MTGFVEKVRRALDPRTLVQRRLKKNGCGVLMTDVPEPRLIVDLDKPGSPLASNATRCDYLVIAEDQQDIGLVALLELKRGQLHADEVVRQLQAGADAAEKLITQDEEVRFRPIAASNRVSKHERTRLKRVRSMVRFHGRKEPIRLMSCGAPLSQELGE